MGLQAAAAAEQKRYNDEMTKTQNWNNQVAGTAETLAKYDPTTALSHLRSLVVSLDQMDISNVDGVKDAAGALDNVDAAKMSVIKGFIEAVNRVNADRIRDITRLIQNWN